MALQHFYSRVPAKMSMFNKTDGYDTFAHSDGLTFEKIDADLSKVYDNKPTKNDAVLIQNGTMPPLYCQYTTGEGQLVQSCMSFMRLDYTGERSAYLVHSLLFDDEERKKLLENPEIAPLNPAMFQKDISGFDMTSFDSHPDDCYPTLEYAPLRAKTTDTLTKEFDSGTLKRVLYSFLCAACGKYKNVYLSMPFAFDTFSDQALSFMNTVMQVIPYHMRSALSFVTYVSDQSKFGDFRIKCQTEDAPIAPVQKGITIRFSIRDAVGLNDDIITKNAELIDFFYGLLTNDALRREFLAFCDNAVREMPALAKASMTNIADLAFLFRQCSGYFNEMSVLPDDNAVYTFVCTYEKYRTAISDDYRAQALKCLWRYPNSHAAIPKNVFAKLSRLYAAEPVASRRNVISVVLELIHTDVMREKLFSFISANYEKEDPPVRKTIMQDLSRVYYGGFLQTSLADFFIQYYDGEPEEIRDLIVEKFLLTIRTEQIQQRVLDFFDSHYDALSEEQKRRFYTTFFEMLREGDQLAEKLIRIVDTHIGKEKDGFRDEFVDRLSSAVQADMKRKQPRILNVIFRTDGYCSETVVYHIFSDWSGRKVFSEYLSNLRALPVPGRTDSILSALGTVPILSEDAAAALSDDLLPSFVTDAGKTEIYQLLETDRRITEFLSGKVSTDKRKFCEVLRDEAIRPAILSSVNSAFGYKKRPDGLAVLRDYAAENSYLANATEYEPVRIYFEIADAVKAADDKAILAGCEKLTDKTVRMGTADHLQAEWLDGNALADEKYDAARFLLGLLITYLKTDIPSASAPYQTLVSDLKKRPSDSAKPNPEQEAQRAEEKAMSILLTLGGETHSAGISETMCTVLFGESAETAQIIAAFIRKYEKKGKKYLLSAIPASAAHGTPYEKIAESVINSTQISSGGFLSKLFGKK